MAGAKRFLSTVVTPASGGYEGGIWQNTTGKPLSVTLGAQAISTNRDACMSMSVGIGTTNFTATVGVSSGDFQDYFGFTGPGVNPPGFTTTFGTFFLGKDCNCPGAGAYCSSTAGIATFIAEDGTETKNWQGGNNIWGCCICLCAGPYPDTSCSSWCANTFWGGQEQINFALSFYNEYSGLCWDQNEPYKNWATIYKCASVHHLGWTMMGTCMFGHCREHPPHQWLVHECHGQDPTKASQTWINHYCCCGKCNYENSSPGTMAICYGANNHNCGGYLNWYALTNNQPDVVSKFWCCDGGCNICMCNNMHNMNCYTYKCPVHSPGDIETYLDYRCMGGYCYCVCFCCECGRTCRDRQGGCCISSFTDCYQNFCRMCCWVHWSEGWTCNYQNCPMNPYGGVAGAATQCAIVRHHKTMCLCQMYFIGIQWGCTWYCQRCSCNLATLDLWINPPQYGNTQCCTNEYSIKYVSWNPQKCCTYLAIRSKVEEQCGIFSWFGSGQENEYREWQVNNSGLYCIWPCDTTYFKKVADFPPSWVSDTKYYDPIMCTTCIHRVEKCLWAIGVYNHTQKCMEPFLSSDLITWNRSPQGSDVVCTTICDAPGNCIIEYMSTTCKWRTCTSFDGLVCKEGIIDWKLSFNNYERTGMIIDCDQRLFINNMANVSVGTHFNFQIWGYEG